MKKYIKSSVEPNNKIYEIEDKFYQIQDLCSELEDFYFGEDVVDQFDQCYLLCERGIKCVAKVLAKLTASSNHYIG